MDKNFQSSFVPLDIAASINEHEAGAQGGEDCRIDALKNHFAWMRGTINGWYGWANDGKSEFRDFLKVIKMKTDKWKFGMFRAEDMDAVMVDGRPKIHANRIYKNLAWNLTGKTWSKNFAKKYFVPQMTLEEEMDALELIEEHFFVVYPKDRKYKNIIDEFTFLYEVKGCNAFEGDPWSSILVPDVSNEAMLDALFDFKEFALRTNTVMDFVNHAKVQRDEKTKDGKFKVVTQFMIPYSGAWDAKMDGQYSIYRPERHISAKDPKVEFHNLKQKNAQVVGVERGTVDKIEFSFTKKQYYFDGINPMTGEVKLRPGEKPADTVFEQPVAPIFDKTPRPPGWTPF
jgi:hypothetical protein